MSRSRYTIHQTLIDIDNCKNKIDIAKKEEERSCDRVYEDKFDIDVGYNDDWDGFRASKASHFLESDIKWYQNDIRKRMKLEKELRLLNLRLTKLQNIRDQQ